MDEKDALIQALVDTLQLALNLIPSAIEYQEETGLNVVYHEIAMLAALNMARRQGYNPK